MCLSCSKEFRNYRTLKRHLRTHTDAKRHVCAYCGKGFHDAYDLKRHRRIHTGVRPYKCHGCAAAFTQRVSLEAHETKLHGARSALAYKQRRAKVYVCEECGHATEHADTHCAHVRAAHPHRRALLNVHDKRAFPRGGDDDRRRGSARTDGGGESARTPGVGCEARARIWPIVGRVELGTDAAYRAELGTDAAYGDDQVTGDMPMDLSVHRWRWPVHTYTHDTATSANGHHFEGSSSLA
ncbi:PREDICTED: putative transcription factor Ovo-like 1 [Priapulus caudatus]|uniref:Transcription factor Ovo-like 1 n=1 Tax=Priapulus caudatus TaxID=37621 RepID=A0ABM1F892_PRICU|nr:PREDICTED: putative transcription factor Ovo-like 1 [Priapulus caudatus]